MEREEKLIMFSSGGSSIWVELLDLLFYAQKRIKKIPSLVICLPLTVRDNHNPSVSTSCRLRQLARSS